MENLWPLRDATSDYSLIRVDDKVLKFRLLPTDL
jgi:hypothetical protein